MELGENFHSSKLGVRSFELGVNVNFQLLLKIIKNSSLLTPHSALGVRVSLC